MTVLKVHHLLLYLPPKHNKENVQTFWAAYHFCMATKYGELRPNSRFKLTLQGKVTTVDSTNAGLARIVFGGWLSQLATQHCGGSALVVPVPSKDAVKGAGCSRSYGMVRDACADYPNIEPLDALRFTKELPKAATQQGSRNPQTLYDAMEVVGCAPHGRKVILVDDIFTSGGSMRAALKRLEEAGFDVAIGAVGGLTVQDTETKPGAGVFDMRKSFVPDFTEIFGINIDDI